MVSSHPAVWTLASLLSVAASANAQWVSGQATHYGPFPQYPAWSEPGFQPGAVGVGCASSSDDPHWNAILSDGVRANPNLPANKNTVWPVDYVVAVSEAVYGGAKKSQYCFQKITVRNSNDHSKQISATIVDFCPAGSCLWQGNALAHNIDVYGGAAWQALGGAPLDGSINVDIIWPGGDQPAPPPPPPVSTPTSTPEPAPQPPVNRPSSAHTVASHPAQASTTQRPLPASSSTTTTTTTTTTTKTTTSPLSVSANVASASVYATPSTTDPAPVPTASATSTPDANWKQCSTGQTSQTYDCKPNSSWICVLGRCECTKGYKFNTETGECVSAPGVDCLRRYQVLAGQRGGNLPC